MSLADYTALLPSELLHAIFAFLPARYRAPTLLRKSPAWVTVSHVCRRWREIALACRSLWTRAPFPNPHWAEEAIRRASPALLYVFIDTALHSEALINIALRDLSQIVSLHLSLASMSLTGSLPITIANAKSVNHVLPACERGPAPYLEELKIEAANDFDLLRREPLTIPSNMFNSVVPPRLRRLVIEDSVLPAGSILLRARLTSLTLTSTRAWSTTDEMRSSLACMPSLDVLILRVDAMVEMEPQLFLSEAESQRVSLLKLRVLDVWCPSLDDSALLLDHIRIPTDTSIFVGCRDPSGASARSLKRFATSIRDFLHSCDSGGFVYAHAAISIPGPWFTYMGTQDIGGATESKLSFSIGRENYVRGSLNITVPQREDWRDQAYDRLQDLLRLPAISSCRVLAVRDFEVYSSPGYWTTLFSDFTQVVDLDLIRRASSTFLISRVATTLFPMLHTLWISEVSITEGDSSLSGQSPYEEMLRENILQRTTSGKLKKIRIFRCDISSDYVRNLNGEVVNGKVEWDGLEMGWQNAREQDEFESSMAEDLSSLDEASEDD